MHGADLMTADHTRSNRTKFIRRVDVHMATNMGNSRHDTEPNEVDELDQTTRHALVLGGLVIFLIICFLAYLLCRKNPPSQSSYARRSQRQLIIQQQQQERPHGDMRQGEEDLPPDYSQLEHTDLLCKNEVFNGPPPSYDELSKENVAWCWWWDACRSLLLSTGWTSIKKLARNAHDKHFGQGRSDRCIVEGWRLILLFNSFERNIVKERTACLLAKMWRSFSKLKFKKFKFPDALTTSVRDSCVQIGPSYFKNLCKI